MNHDNSGGINIFFIWPTKSFVDPPTPFFSRHSLRPGGGGGEAGERGLIFLGGGSCVGLHGPQEGIGPAQLPFFLVGSVSG